MHDVEIMSRLCKRMRMCVFIYRICFKLFFYPPAHPQTNIYISQLFLSKHKFLYFLAKLQTCFPFGGLALQLNFSYDNKVSSISHHPPPQYPKRIELVSEKEVQFAEMPFIGLWEILPRSFPFSIVGHLVLILKIIETLTQRWRTTWHQSASLACAVCPCTSSAYRLPPFFCSMPSMMHLFPRQRS